VRARPHHRICCTTRSLRFSRSLRTQCAPTRTTLRTLVATAHTAFYLRLPFLTRTFVRGLPIAFIHYLVLPHGSLYHRCLLVQHHTRSLLHRYGLHMAHTTHIYCGHAFCTLLLVYGSYVCGLPTPFHGCTIHAFTRSGLLRTAFYAVYAVHSPRLRHRHHLYGHAVTLRTVAVYHTRLFFTRRSCLHSPFAHIHIFSVRFGCTHGSFTSFTGLRSGSPAAHCLACSSRTIPLRLLRATAPHGLDGSLFLDLFCVYWLLHLCTFTLLRFAGCRVYTYLALVTTSPFTSLVTLFCVLLVHRVFWLRACYLVYIVRFAAYGSHICISLFTTRSRLPLFFTHGSPVYSHLYALFHAVLLAHLLPLTWFAWHCAHTTVRFTYGSLRSTLLPRSFTHAPGCFLSVHTFLTFHSWFCGWLVCALPRILHTPFAARDPGFTRFSFTHTGSHGYARCVVAFPTLVTATHSAHIATVIGLQHTFLAFLGLRLLGSPAFTNTTFLGYVGCGSWFVRFTGLPLVHFARSFTVYTSYAHRTRSRLRLLLRGSVALPTFSSVLVHIYVHSLRCTRFPRAASFSYVHYTLGSCVRSRSRLHTHLPLRTVFLHSVAWSHVRCAHSRSFAFTLRLPRTVIPFHYLFIPLLPLDKHTRLRFNLVWFCRHAPVLHT